MYTFRVLREEEKNIAESFGMLCANSGIEELPMASSISITETIAEALDNSLSHILKGSSNLYGWISTSKSLCESLNNYSQLTSSNNNILKPYVALIANHDRNCLTLDTSLDDNYLDFTKHTISDLNSIKDYPSTHISKLVLDMSTKEAQRILFDNSVIYTKKGTKPRLNSRICNYASSSKEVLVYDTLFLKKVPRFIDSVLTPLESDILYDLYSKNLVYKKEYVEYMVLHNFRLFFEKFDLSKLLSPEELEFYNCHYIKRLQLSVIARYLTTGSSLEDYKKNYNYCLKLKSNVLKKVIMLYDYRFRLGNINTDYIYFTEYPSYITPKINKEQVLNLVNK